VTDEAIKSAIKDFLEYAALPHPEYVLRHGEFVQSTVGPPDWERWVERRVTEDELDEAIDAWLIQRRHENDD